MSSPSLTGLLVMNVLLAVFCGGAVRAVSIAVCRDWRERRALVPSCWPPAGASQIDRKHGKEMV